MAPKINGALGSHLVEPIISVSCSLIATATKHGAPSHQMGSRSHIIASVPIFLATNNKTGLRL
jgi:hypothetical protein